MSAFGYRKPADLPQTIPLFPLVGAILMPRGVLALNVFEPRYLNMVDDALGGDRLIGMIQPQGSQSSALYATGCAGRITQIAETGDGRYLIQLTGICRFKLVEDVATDAAFRSARVNFAPFLDDLDAGLGEGEVDREAVLAALRSFSDANQVPVDWSSIQQAPNEALVNALSMMAPYGLREKQALLEAMTLKDRAEMLIAITEMEIARKDSDTESSLQ